MLYVLVADDGACGVEGRQAVTCQAIELSSVRFDHVFCAAERHCVVTGLPVVWLQKLLLRVEPALASESTNYRLDDSLFCAHDIGVARFYKPHSPFGKATESERKQHLAQFVRYLNEMWNLSPVVLLIVPRDVAATLHNNYGVQEVTRGEARSVATCGQTCN